MTDHESTEVESHTSSVESHKFGSHKWHDCAVHGHMQNAEQCSICRGGLSYCVVCGHAEGAIADYNVCPGEVDLTSSDCMDKLRSFHYSVAPLFRAANVYDFWDQWEIDRLEAQGFTPVRHDLPQLFWFWDYGAWQYLVRIVSVTPHILTLQFVDPPSDKLFTLEDWQDNAKHYAPLGMYDPYGAIGCYTVTEDVD
jgi:hypothetical protein